MGIAIDFSAIPHVSEADDDEEWDAEVAMILSRSARLRHMVLFVGYEDVASIVTELREEPTLNTLPLLLTDGVASVTLATFADASELEQVFGVQPGYRTGAAYEHFVEIYEDPVHPHGLSTPMTPSTSSPTRRRA